MKKTIVGFILTWVIYDKFMLLYIIYATFKLDDYVLSTVVTKSKLEATVFIAP